MCGGMEEKNCKGKFTETAARIGYHSSDPAPWILSSPGRYTKYYSLVCALSHWVNFGGTVNLDDSCVNEFKPIRPAIWIALKF